ncbi:hypothetical protein ACFFTN_21085 [Aminobacter aganoensis]|uniref:Uncharacterized protein n=1 Tax=Aminobacter aganoensis TaxID=83264 RepID=A0A7X0FC24_9HYPH|nr:hypothetical protein [Aminobacter aganoensis]MBB6356935.1 hypothetical protein [Aminobacter aganoensis]
MASNVVVLADVRNEREPVTVEPARPADSWDEGWARVQMCHHQRNVAWWHYRLAVAVNGLHSLEVMQARRYRASVERAWEHEAYHLLFVPAPAVRFLRWKERFAMGSRWSPKVEAALVRDRINHAVRIESNRKAATSRKARKGARS